MENNWNSHRLQEGMQNYTVPLEYILAVSHKDKHTSPYNIAIPFRGFYLPRELKTYIQIKTYMQIFITDLVIITKN